MSPSGSPVPSRYSAPPLPSVTSTSPTSTHFPSDDSGGTLPSTSKTSPSNTEVSDVPRISSTTFTSLLGALLTDQSTMVAKATQASLVRFLCLLKGKPIPGESSRDSSPFNDLESEPIPFHRTEFASLVHPRSPYHLNAEARRLLEDEFLTGIVLGLARLDEDEREGEKSVAGSEGGFPSASARRASSSVQSEEGQQPPSLFLSPEEEVLDVNEAWLSSSPESTTALPVLESWDAEPLVSFFDDALDRTDSTQFSMEGVPNLAASPLSPADPMVYSNFSPDLRGDEESSLGKLVSMSLIAAIAAADCLEPEVLMQQILPEVDRMKSEPMFYVRKEAMHALGCLARTLPLEVFEVAVVSHHHLRSYDQVTDDWYSSHCMRRSLEIRSGTSDEPPASPSPPSASACPPSSFVRRLSPTSRRSAPTHPATSAAEPSKSVESSSISSTATPGVFLKNSSRSSSDKSHLLSQIPTTVSSPRSNPLSTPPPRRSTAVLPRGLRRRPSSPHPRTPTVPSCARSTSPPSPSPLVPNPGTSSSPTTRPSATPRATKSASPSHRPSTRLPRSLDRNRRTTVSSSRSRGTFEIWITSKAPSSRTSRRSSVRSLPRVRRKR